MNYTFKYINLPDDHTFDEDHLAFLRTIDQGFCKAADASSPEVEKMQKQINHAFLEMEKLKQIGPGEQKRIHSSKERELNNKWDRNFLNKKDNSIVEKELEIFHTKDFDSYLDTSDSSTGGYLIPELLLNEIQHVAEEVGIARREMRYLPFGGPGNTRKIPTEASGITIEWINEGEAKPISNITLSQVSQTLEKMAVISVMTEELIEDSNTDLVGYTSRRIGEEIALEEDNQFFAGVGSPFTGIINNSDIVPVSMDATETLDDLSPDDLLSMIYAIPAKYRRGAKFYMSSDAMLKLLQYRSSSVASGDDEGQYLIITPMQSEPSKLWGYPVVICDALPDLETANTADSPFLIFGNLSRCSVYGDKSGGMKVKILSEATLEDSEGNTISLAQTDTVGIRTHKRVGYCLTLPQGIAVLQTGSVS